MKVKVLKNITDMNDQLAARNKDMFAGKGILVINVMSSPGAGKTSLLLKTIELLGDDARVGVIEGDIASSVDAEKIAATGSQAIQINTDGGCHLDANMVASAADGLELDKLDIIFIENVGNLVCPAGFQLGEAKRVVLASVPEGDDKPTKYPFMFRDTDVIVITKMDYLPLSDFNMESFRKTVLGLNPDVKIIELSVRNGQGLDEWTAWLKSNLLKGK
ncbi:MAG: hydrogenase nickel incorporation protein HypB [Dehalococcoides mccartyi]|jgi:hydrogenase accessory protein HypB|uniref:Hydrogenase accessory protein HypB n=3 Tax=root TaxID=1 RepID=A0AB33HUJ9_9CHLR|nr:hydrogenase nickel incorporation protein HypB [Dehalococcoides mccartyi]AAW39282.1 hydrogenase accessory protein HypB [Dehalococcoides mccartyi 195]AII59971.1 hydantoin utilization protein A [Dehalococcoides mccartyi CG4]AQU03640.1 hydrogenase accessory protein HypB [Dehalococcoides mccartyi]AQU04940.1 hydrogenase accessory protein HypB [Dehalococcoides mccartyi]MCF7635652.1 hydrogenase accessory protein HypB [Dehalococcoides mccartyi]